MDSLNHDSLPEPENCTINNPYCPDPVESLASGLIDLYKPKLTNVNHQLKELTTKQNILVEQLHDENLKISWVKNSEEIIDMFNTIKVYQTKLFNIKREMRNLHDKSAKLRKRALRLQQYKEKATVAKTQQMQHEENLIPKRNDK
ncbi:hypothetical protein RI129_002059 [Pyrocoelia pectoralis]|uniref:Biogenesis of lysosome-related organelles complex 1 subunit 6 n=1 Tax=Pyrocoelia pectoralis TaxID=417401 RepID=A0AAN7ZLR0_9COLE